MAFISVLLVAALCAFCEGYIWESTVRISMKERFQEIPKPEETANKIEKDFLDRQGQQAPKTLSVFDVVFLIDSSGSISQEDFQVELQGMLALIKRMKPGTGIAALTFSTHARVIFPFLSAEKAMARILKIKHSGKKTNTLDALKKARTNLLLNLSSGIRMDSYKRIFMLTDGKPNAEGNTLPALLYEAQSLKMLGIEIFVLVIGERVDGVEEIAGLASSTDRHFYRVANSSDFVSVVKLISLYPLPPAAQGKYHVGKDVDKEEEHVEKKTGH